jgi:drug/metabolite transporter (DMT)-like permease
MMIPWILITNAEIKISSGLAGLLIATVPIWSTIFASITGDKTVWHSKRLVGILVGFVGLVGLVGYESIIGSSDPLSIAMMLVTAMSYSYAVNMISQKLPDVSGIAINGLAMIFTAIAYAPLMIVQFPEVSTVSKEAAISLIALGVFSTSLAFISYFIVMKEIGPARASVITYVNTAIAVVLGVVILSEPLTLGIIIGLPLVMIGSFLASRKPTVSA